MVSVDVKHLVYLLTRQPRSSSDTTILYFNSVRKYSLGQRSFTYAAPSLWNSLHAQLGHQTRIFQIITEISLLQAILLTHTHILSLSLSLYGCVCVRERERESASEWVSAFVLTMFWFFVLCFVMGYGLQFGVTAYERIHYYYYYTTRFIDLHSLQLDFPSTYTVSS